MRTAGSHLGRYELLDSLGAGGMGEVFRARDTSLGREVALKVLPERFALDAHRRARFQREARLLGSLSHPNIATLYGLEETGGVQTLALELVEGETLAERLASLRRAGSRLPTAEALAIAGQIAAAFEAAHERGVVHRDLKPSNVALRHDGAVKVLDFGLAKALEREHEDAGEQTPTVTEIGAPGAALGTPAYMSPEQARGLPVDKRTDIWAFGCVLYELLTGERAFAGETSTDVIAKVLERQPAFEALPADVSPAIRRLLRRCLEKDPQRRLRDIGDARLELADSQALEALVEAPSVPPARPRSSGAAARVLARFGAPTATAWTATAGALVLAAAGVWLLDDRSAAPVTVPSEYEQLTNLADSAVAPSLSPDGRMVAFKVGEDFFLSGGQIYVKLLPNGDSVQLTQDAAVKYGPVFTPDGSRIAYTQLNVAPQGVSWDTHVVPVLGGEPAPLLRNASGLTWLDERRVLFAEIMTGMHMGIVAATENRAEKHDVYWPDHTVGMAHYAWASPDRRWALVVEMDQSHAFRNPCRVVPFDGHSSGRAVGPNGTCTSASWSPDGRWMYFSATVDGSSHLWRQRFPDGKPEQITFGPTEQEGVAVAPDGRSVVTALGMRRSSIRVHDRGEERPIVTEGYSYAPRLSVGGTRVYYLLKQHSSAPTSTLRVLDLASGRTETVLSGQPIVDYDISRDETEVAYTIRDDAGESQIWHSSLDRRTPARLIARNADTVSFGAARDLIFRSLEGLENSIVRASLDGNAAVQRIDTPLVHRKGAVSPNGEWVIVASPGAADQTSSTLAVPVHGGPARTICINYCAAAWSPDGRFFYVPVGAAAVNLPRRTLAFPVPEGGSLPELPAEAPNANTPYAEFPGAHVIDEGFVAPGATLGSDPSRYVFTKVEFHRNLFRIPIR